MMTLRAPDEPDSLFKMSSMLQEMVNAKLASTEPGMFHFSFIQFKVLQI